MSSRVFLRYYALAMPPVETDASEGSDVRARNIEAKGVP